MDLNRALERLKEARQNKDWITIARILAEVRESGAWRKSFPSHSDWLNAVAAALDYSPATLRRMIAARSFLDDVTGQEPKLQVMDPAVGSGGFLLSTIEILKRLHDLDPDAAMKRLWDVQSGRVGYRSLKKEYDSYFPDLDSSSVVRNPPYQQRSPFPPADSAKVGVRRAKLFAEQAQKAVAAQLEEFSGPGCSFHFRRYRFDYASPDAVAIGRKGFSIEFVDGFEFRQLGSRLPRSELNRLLADLALASTFFRRYWLITTAHARTLESLSRSLDRLALRSVGLGQARDERIEIAAAPSGAPTPDRQELGKAAVYGQGITT